MKRVHTTLVLPDVHVPFHNEEILFKIRALMREVRPNALVFTGDFLDLYTLSRHNEGSLAKLGGLTLSQEYEEGNNVLDLLEEHLAKGASKYYLFGNHENRYARFMEKGDSAKLGDELASPEEGLRLADRGYIIKRNWQDDSVYIGKHLEAIHGNFLVDHCAKKHLDAYEGSVIFGHTHRFQSYVNGKRAAYNIGFLGERDSVAFAYAPKATRNKWVNGFAIVYTLDDGTFLVNAIQCWGNRFVVDGRLY